MGIKINSVYPYEQDKSQQILSILELVVLSLIKNLMSGNYQHDKIKGNPKLYIPSMYYKRLKKGAH